MTDTRVSQSVAEVLANFDSSLAVGQAVIEVLHSNDDVAGGITVSQVVMEALVKVESNARRRRPVYLPSY